MTHRTFSLSAILVAALFINAMP
ncbi:uncharacterized protein METZ01_LOCUS314790, partial [marine metagenome]